MSRGWRPPIPNGWEQVLAAALQEDVGPGDLTSAFFTEHETVEWFVEAQESGVVCGVGIAAAALPGARIEVGDGEPVEPGTRVLTGRGSAGPLLSAERTALNFLMHLSGVATRTNAFVRAVDGTGVRITDARKTLPGLRLLQKYAVRCGGGYNHRMGLYDGVLIKDNHIAAAGSVWCAINRVRAMSPHTLRIEIECTTRDMVGEAVDAGADIVLLDNMPLPVIAEAVETFGDRVLLEASGGVTLENVRAIAETGLPIISIGAITHSAPALSFHLELG